MHSRSESELEGVELGDERLNARVQALFQSVTESPEAPLAEACGNRAATKAAYRFLENPRVQHEDIMAAHIANTVERCSKLPLVLVPQDTTDVDYSGRQATGLGHLYSKKSLGLFLHTAFAITPEGVPLGVLFQRQWAREPGSKGVSAQRRQREFLDKESARWADAEAAVAEVANIATRVINIADREGDIFEWLMRPRPVGLDRLVRACRDRLTVGGGKLLSEVAQSLPILGWKLVEVGRAPGREPRTAAVTLRAGRIELPPPTTLKGRKSLPNVSVWVVVAEEVTPPSGIKAPLHWVLLATWPVETLEAALEAVHWYSRRWVIERFHFVLKSGCQVEKLQLESVESLKRAIALYSVAAWRILWLTLEARARPDASCEGVLEEAEWKALQCWVTGSPVPGDEPPTLKQAVHWIAQWGGFQGRKSDGEPGPKVIWRGWARLQVAAEMYRLFFRAGNQLNS